MTADCSELEVALSLRAAGALDAAEAARVDAHLAGCPACREEAARTAELLQLARLPPPTLSEHRVLSDLPARVAAGTRPERAPVEPGSRLRNARRVAAGLLVASGIAAVAIVPVMVRQRRPPAAATAAVASAAPVGAAAAKTANGENDWQEPDLDTLWQDASVLGTSWDGGE